MDNDALTNVAIRQFNLGSGLLARFHGPFHDGHHVRLHASPLGGGVASTDPSAEPLGTKCAFIAQRS